MSTIPTSIPFSSIVFGSRERTEYSYIDELAESIEDLGMICPLVLSPLSDGTYLLEAGGRRYRALEKLGVTELFHAVVGKPGVGSFVLKSEQSTKENSWMTELVENTHRESMHWMDEMRLIVKAWKAARISAGQKGERLYYATFGKMLGYGYSDVNAAVCIHDAVLADPEHFADCTSIHRAYARLLEDSKKALAIASAQRSMPTAAPVSAALQPTLGEVAPIEGKEGELEPTSVIKIPFSQRFYNTNSLDWMSDISMRGSFDHIITDPDFAVSKERLSAGVSGAAEGVAQENVEASLYDLERFIRLAYQCIQPSGFLVFFYDLDHHEKLQSWVRSAGFSVQRWPLIWHKTDYRSNAAPTYNFCKNIEYAMICRKGGAVLESVQMSSVISLPSGTTAKDFSHPFAKPVALWQRIMSAISHPGQRVYDPFMGAGSCPASGIDFGLDMYGSELSTQHFSNAVLNLQSSFRKKYGPGTLFS